MRHTQGSAQMRFPLWFFLFVLVGFLWLWYCVHEGTELQQATFKDVELLLAEAKNKKKTDESGQKASSSKDEAQQAGEKAPSLSHHHKAATTISEEAGGGAGSDAGADRSAIEKTLASRVYDLEAKLKEAKKRATHAEGELEDIKKEKVQLADDLSAAEEKLKKDSHCKNGGGEEEAAENDDDGEKDHKRHHAKKKHHRRHEDETEHGDEVSADAGSANDVSHASVSKWIENHRGIVARDCLTLGSDLEQYLVVMPEKLPGWARPYKPGTVLGEKKESGDIRKESFSSIAEQKSWGRGASPSGTGSAKGDATDHAIATLRKAFSMVQQDLGSEANDRRIRMIDIPCGDLNWMPQFLDPLSEDIEYWGFDIVPDLIKKHKEHFHAKKWMHFKQLDVVEHGLPKNVKADIIFSRHMLQHLATADAMRVIKSVNEHPTAKYFVTTTYPDWQAYVDLNVDSDTRVRKLNLQLPPIAMPEPLCWAYDFSFSVVAIYKLPLKFGPGSEIADV